MGKLPNDDEPFNWFKALLGMILVGVMLYFVCSGKVSK